METTQQKYQSLTTKEQLHIVRRLLGFAAQYRRSCLLSMVAVLVQSVMNMLLPRIWCARLWLKKLLSLVKPFIYWE